MNHIDYVYIGNDGISPRRKGKRLNHHIGRTPGASERARARTHDSIYIAAGKRRGGGGGGGKEKCQQILRGIVAREKEMLSSSSRYALPREEPGLSD